MIIKLPTKSYVDRRIFEPSNIRNNAQVDFNDKNLDNVKFVKAVREHLTPKIFVDQNNFYHVDELSLLRLYPIEELKLDEQASITLNSSLRSPKTIKELPTKKYVDSLQESSRNGRDLSSVFNDHDNEFDNIKLIKLDSVSVNGNPSSDNELAKKKSIDDELDTKTILRFIQTVQNYLKVSVDDTYNLTKHNKIQLSNTTFIKQLNGQYLLLQWKLICNDKNNNGIVFNFIRAARSSSPTDYSGASSLPPIGTSFTYIETSSKNHGHERVFVSWERTDVIQITNLTFYYNRFSVLTDKNSKSMSRFQN